MWGKHNFSAYSKELHDICCCRADFERKLGQTDQPDCLETCCCRADFERKLGRKWKYDAKAVAEQSRVGWVELCETQQTIAINRWVEKRNPTYALATNGLIIAIQVLRE